MTKFQNVSSHICTCRRLLPEGCFTVGKEYGFTYMIDSEQLVDDKGQIVVLSEKTFHACFDNVTEVVTSYCPMAQDKTIYSVFLRQGGDESNIKDIQACAKILNVNYINARKMLNQNKVLLAQGKAMDIHQVLEKLADFDVNYEIEPPYPYEF